jgi:Trk-type K+ transport system membrane component
MEKSSARLESIKMVKEWSVWLVTLQGAACTVLWQPLKQQSVEQSLGYFLLLLGWLTFVLSIITATVLLGLLPRVVESLADQDSRLYDKRVSSLPVYRKITISHFMFVEHALLIIGILFILIFVLARQPKGDDAPEVGVVSQQLHKSEDKQIELLE